MKKIFFVILMIFTLFLIACGGGEDYKIILGGDLEVEIGESVTWTAEINKEGASLVWSSSDEAIATVSHGVITGVSEGTATITVALEEDESINASKTINVVNKEIVYEIEISETSLDMVVGDIKNIDAKVYPNTELVWSSSNNSIATVNGGKITAVSKGEATIIVSTVDGSITKKITVNVSEEAGYSRNQLMSDLIILKNEYFTANSVNVKIETALGNIVTTSNLIYNKDSNGLFEELKYEIKGNVHSALYVKDGMAYMLQETAKIKSELTGNEDSILATKNSASAILKDVTCFYNEDAFYAALEKVKEENNQVVFKVNLNDYLGSMLKVDGVDSITFVVTLHNEKIIDALLVYVTQGITTSTKVYYNGTDKQTIEFPNDLDSYVE